MQSGGGQELEGEAEGLLIGMGLLSGVMKMSWNYSRVADCTTLSMC